MTLPERVSVADDGVSGQIDGDEVGAGLHQRFADLLKPDAEMLFVHRETEISVVVIVIVLEGKALGGNSRFAAFEIINGKTKRRFLGRLALVGADESVYVVTAVARNDERDLDGLPGEGELAGKALVVVGVSGKESMGIDADFLADGVDIEEHVGTAAVISATNL